MAVGGQWLNLWSSHVFKYSNNDWIFKVDYLNVYDIISLYLLKLLHRCHSHPHPLLLSIICSNFLLIISSNQIRNPNQKAWYPNLTRKKKPFVQVGAVAAF